MSVDPRSLAEPYTREERLRQHLTSVLAELVVPKPITDWLRSALQETDTTQIRAREQALQQATTEYERINTRIEAMYLDKLDGRITTAFYDEKAATWRQEQTALGRRINELRFTTQNYNDAINNIETTSTLCKTFPTQTPTEQRRLLKLLLEKATWQDGRLETTLRPPFQKLRVSNQGTTRKQKGNGTSGQEIENWLPECNPITNTRMEKLGQGAFSIC